MSLQMLMEEVVGEMYKLVKDFHKIPSGKEAMNRHAYRMAVLVDLSNILMKICYLSGHDVEKTKKERKYMLMTKKDFRD